jgi:chromosome segregation ATPase
LQLQVNWAERDKESALRSVAAAEQERDDMAAQQANWDDLRRTAQQVETLTKLLTSGENEELRELRRARDRSKVLEGEHAALQRRFKDQEAKLAELDRAATHARQTAATANQKASDAESRVNDLEAELEAARDSLERADDLRQQIEAEYSLLEAHVQDKELNEAAARVRIPTFFIISEQDSDQRFRNGSPSCRMN